MDSGGPGEENYWPGFVDALSNVVLTLVFVLVVFVFALSMGASKVEQRMKEVVAAEKVHQEKIAAVAREKAAAEKESAMEGEDKNVNIVSEEKKTAAATHKGGVDVAGTSGHIVLSYPLSMVDMDEKSMADLSRVLEIAKQKSLGAQVRIQSVPGKEPYSAARRLAYYRAIKVRNLLIEKGFGTNGGIQSKIVQPVEPDLGHVEIIFER